MKRTPLVRKTPLARGNGLTRAHATKPKTRLDRVDPTDHRAVRVRDGACFGVIAYREQQYLAGGFPAAPWMTADLPPIEPHQCRDTFGNMHLPNALERLTVDHFHHHVGGTKGKRATSDRLHMVAMCAGLNGRPPPTSIREAERAYAAWLARG